MSEKQLSIIAWRRNNARGNRQIIRIPRTFACISAGAPRFWWSVMQITGPTHAKKLEGAVPRSRLTSHELNTPHLEEYPLGLVSRYSTVRSGTLTWREWGLWYKLTKFPNNPISWNLFFSIGSSYALWGNSYDHSSYDHTRWRTSATVSSGWAWLWYLRATEAHIICTQHRYVICCRPWPDKIPD